MSKFSYNHLAHQGSGVLEKMEEEKRNAGKVMKRKSCCGVGIGGVATPGAANLMDHTSPLITFVHKVPGDCDIISFIW